jgi:hypothetical protein
LQRNVGARTEPKIRFVTGIGRNSRARFSYASVVHESNPEFLQSVLSGTAPLDLSPPDSVAVLDVILSAFIVDETAKNGTGRRGLRRRKVEWSRASEANGVSPNLVGRGSGSVPTASGARRGLAFLNATLLFSVSE